MENITEYIDVLIQAPIAVILIVFIYLSIKLITTFMTLIMNQLSQLIKDLTIALNDAIKIIKQQARKE